MDKESIIELQKIDCNCNECYFFQRDNKKLKEKQERDDLLFKQTTRRDLYSLYEDLEEIQCKKEKTSEDIGVIGHIKEQIKNIEKRQNLGRSKPMFLYGWCANENSINFMKDLSIIPGNYVGNKCFIHRTEIIKK